MNVYFQNNIGKYVEQIIKTKWRAISAQKSSYENGLVVLVDPSEVKGGLSQNVADDQIRSLAIADLAQYKDTWEAYFWAKKWICLSHAPGTSPCQPTSVGQIYEQRLYKIYFFDGTSIHGY